MLTASEPAVADSCPPPPPSSFTQGLTASTGVIDKTAFRECLNARTSFGNIVMGANQAAIQDVSHRRIKISWNESLLITGSHISDVTVQPSVLPRSFRYYRGLRDVFSLLPSPFLRPQNKVFMSVSSSKCRGCSEDWGRSRQ